MTASTSMALDSADDAAEEWKMAPLPLSETRIGEGEPRSDERAEMGRRGAEKGERVWRVLEKEGLERERFGDEERWIGRRRVWAIVFVMDGRMRFERFE